MGLRRALSGGLCDTGLVDMTGQKAYELLSF